MDSLKSVSYTHLAPKLENNAVTFYQKDGRTYMQGTVYDEDGSLASVAVHAQVSRTYTDSTGREITEYNIDLLNPLYSQSIYDADTHTFTFTADVTEYRGSYNWTGNVYLSCGDYAANDRTYAIKVDASQGLTPVSYPHLSNIRAAARCQLSFVPGGGRACVADLSRP